jgi:transcriptional regulator with XRE-family HTH domain
MLMIGERLRTIRESKNLSQGDIEKRTGLIRCYTSRVENGHTVPSLDTLQKYAQALEIPVYQLFYDGEEAPRKIKGLDLDGSKLSNSERREIEGLGRKFTKLKERDKRACAAVGCEAGTGHVVTANVTQRNSSKFARFAYQ